MANVMEATQFLNNAPIHGETPVDQAAREVMDFLKTSITQQAQYSQELSYLHATPYQSVSRQVDSPGPAVSSSHRQHGAPPAPGPQRAVRITNQLANPTPERRVGSVIQLP